MSDGFSTKRSSAKNNVPNKELVEAAQAARNLGYHSYGQMQAKQLAKEYTSDIKKTIAKKRRDNGYTTIRERMGLAEAKGNEPDP